MNTEDAIKGVVHWRSQIHEKGLWSDREALSDVLAKLSVYSCYLADNLAGAHKIATDKAYAVFTEATAGGEGVTKAEMLARGESTTERETYENMRNILKATEGLIMTIHKKLNVMEGKGG